MLYFKLHWLNLESKQIENEKQNVNKDLPTAKLSRKASKSK